jgi:uncharacterized repeat protein (TIGR03806 family)
VKRSAIVLGLTLAACGPDPDVGLDGRPANPRCLAPERFPDSIIDTGCFEGSPPRPVDALVPYSVRVALWSDGADKDRYVALPDGARMEAGEDGRIALPPGAVLVKTFRFGNRLLETRFFALGEDGEWRAATYVWNEDGTVATRSDGGTFEVGEREWTVPGPSDCFECHSEAAGVSLGLEVGQLDAELTYPQTGRSGNQLETLQAVGMLAPLTIAADALPRFEPDDARAYLHVNCAICHRPAGNGIGAFDLRIDLPLEAMNVCGVRPELGDPTGDAALVFPRDPSRSVLRHRMASDDPTWRMPPLGSAIVDEGAVALIDAWIEGIEACP